MQSRRLLDRLLDRLRSTRNGLASPRALLAVIVISTLVVAPSLGSGLAADDYFHRVQLTRNAAWAAIVEPWHELFTFYDGDPARTQHYLERGLSVWWTDPHLVAAFFRPVSAFTHRIDYALWPSQPWLMHLQSLAWYAALVGVAGWLYQRLIAHHAPATGAWAAGLAALLYGLDHNHAMPVGWIANRNAVVAAVFSLAALAAHHLAVKADTRRAPWTIASALLLALALGAGESSVGVVGFLVAHALYLDARTLRARCASLLPHVGVTLAWIAIYRGGGFGVRGSGMYFEPLREPVQLGVTVLSHLPLLLASELGGPPPDVYPFLPTVGKAAMVVVALAMLTWSASAIVRVVRAEPLARFFVVGGVLAALPACAVFPAGRLLTIAGFGLIGVLALAGAGVADGASWVPKARSRALRSFAIWACGGHLFLSPFVMQIGIFQMPVIARFLKGLGQQLPASSEDAKRRVVLLNAPDTLLVTYVMLPRQLAGDLVPARLLTLAGGARTIEVTRTDDRTVVVRAEGGFYRTGTELVTRSGAMPVGTKVALTDVTIEIVGVGSDGVPTEAAFHFEPSADSDAFVWMRWEGKDLVTVRPPAIGERIVIPGQIPQLL